jgi:hypothetical protein
VERHLHFNGEPVRASAGDRRWRMGSYCALGSAQIGRVQVPPALG